MSDAAYKELFSHPRMVEDLLHGIVAPEWSGALDFTTLEKLPAEYVSDELRRRQGDLLWRVRFRDRWLYVLVLLESQSTVDPYMALRLLVYTGLLYQDLIRRGALEQDEKLPPVLPIVFYNGRSRWTAALEVSDLMAPVSEALAPYQPSQRYFLVDVGRYGNEDLPQHNLVSALIALENSRSAADLKRAVDALADWLQEAEARGLKRSFGEWIRQVLVPRRFGSTELPPMPRLEEVQTMLAERVKEWTEEWFREGLEQGRAEERVLLCRMTARKFDAETAEATIGAAGRCHGPGPAHRARRVAHRVRYRGGSARTCAAHGCLAPDRVTHPQPPRAAPPSRYRRRPPPRRFAQTPVGIDEPGVAPDYRR